MSLNNNRNRRNAQGRRGSRRRNGSNSQRNLPMVTPSREGPMNMLRQPTLHPIVSFSRTIEGLYDITNSGVTPALNAWNFSLNDIPGYTEFTALFQSYCIEQIEIWWRPEYTVLSDASALSTAVNVEFNSAIDLVDGTAPATVDTVLEYQSAAHTSITTTHYRKFKPAYLIDNQMPACGLISTASPSVNWFGVKTAIPATGAAMTFRSIAKFKIAFVGCK